ncbi:class I SAM-dependent methyltransferase [uncultured Polaribacter sp.]|uniref:class I SAM-dependent methyltransferase n=1 Tax=uncultured Polaribacter sp. TaxID=174711 RepID=UPI0030DC400B|tara:strand:- start:1303 stop:1980 length:678 start_codon:yes stop_codon:yes gene_type:complete
MKDTKKTTKKIKKPWPTKAAMEQVYERNLWGSDASDFYSGDGSHQPEIVDPYVAVVHSFLTSFKTPITVCDLGCGDFNVGKELVKYSKNYIAVDIVCELIKFNKETFKSANLAFHCLDIAKDDLPKTDCVIIRQVFQHISNKEIQNIVHKLADYKYVIVTEHLPFGDFTPNIDIISGQGIRLKKQSGVVLTAPPFNFKVTSEKKLVSVGLKNNKGVILTTLYEVF